MTSSLPDTPIAETPTEPRKPTLVLGGGPAGLTAGYLLAKRELPVTVFARPPT
jgi:NADPH-dependent glutamate synthase beta subunit-like oxidoreductase